MADPYVGEIRRFPFNDIPNDWLACNGQELSVSEYNALFQAIGTTYGGDGTSTFALPDLQGRTPVGVGGSAGSLGAEGGGTGESMTYLAIAYAIALVGIYPEA